MALKKITIMVPEELVSRAQEATGQGITPTIRRALELIAAGQAYDKLRALRGKVKVSIDLEAMREDRD